jgi:legumain
MPRRKWRLLLVALTALSATGGASGEHWAVIVAGSRGYENYRHQADACHAYHVARRHGIPAENVVLMMYDDVATAKENPFPGKLYNRATTSAEKNAAEDVYAGCHVDYAGEHVTPANFLSVLVGNATATSGKKVLASGPDDRVFVNFVDHGARGFVVFPHGQMLTASQLTGSMETMYKQKRYHELVLYVEGTSLLRFWNLFQEVLIFVLQRATRVRCFGAGP